MLGTILEEYRPSVICCIDFAELDTYTTVSRPLAEFLSVLPSRTGNKIDIRIGTEWRTSKGAEKPYRWYDTEKNETTKTMGVK